VPIDCNPTTVRVTVTGHSIDRDTIRLRLRDADRHSKAPDGSPAVCAECSGVTVFNAWKYDHVSHLLRDLHWLRVPERIKFRLAIHVFRCHCNMAPPYLSRDFHWTDEAESLQRLRSGSQLRLVDPRTRLRTIGDRCFRVMAARACNSLPTSVTTATSLFSFKRQLKTFLFTKSFPEL